MRKIQILLPIILLTATMTNAFAHEIPWPSGMSRQMGVGTCAKGPCVRRTSFNESVPHQHVGRGKCIGKGAAGYTFGRRFKCSVR